MMISWEFLLVLLLGLCGGSFVNVLIVRLPRNRSLFFPSSRCGFCRSSIPWFMNVPLFSFLVTGGKCFRCGYAYSWRYPFVEVLTTLLFWATFSSYGWNVTLIFLCFYIAFFVAISFIDLELRIIPNGLSLGGWVVAIGASFLELPAYPVSFKESLLGALFGSLLFFITSRLFYFLTHREGLGGGDVKLLGFIGAVGGVQGVVTTVLVGSLTGMVIGLLQAFQKGKSMIGFAIPFGPFLVLGALIHLFHLDTFFWELLTRFMIP